MGRVLILSDPARVGRLLMLDEPNDCEPGRIGLLIG